MLIPLSEQIWSGFASTWKTLPPPPAKPEQLLGTGTALGYELRVIEGEDQQGYVQGDVYVLAVDGQVYNFEEHDQSWRRGLIEHVASREQCDASGAIWDRKQGECVQGQEYLGPVHRYLLDQDGILWHAIVPPKIFPSYAFCGSAGLVLGILVTIAQKTRKGWKVQSNISTASLD